MVYEEYLFFLSDTPSMAHSCAHCSSHDLVDKRSPVLEELGLNQIIVHRDVNGAPRIWFHFGLSALSFLGTWIDFKICQSLIKLTFSVIQTV